MTERGPRKECPVSGTRCGAVRCGVRCGAVRCGAVRSQHVESILNECEVRRVDVRAVQGELRAQVLPVRREHPAARGEEGAGGAGAERWLYSTRTVAASGVGA